eukprot:CAMPEP_0171335446 /NCGR_PEP_ID=MMETSP0878-20121228/5339_1 /TAXON_ID=67004 /ORGANISM="Thalassiosira weissflogii, Strain CCMP1336" /LENGTH=199 /DNA_ID=CAMNT_0011836717 /DNA_START=59 /DNA_END=658 /DNA_ORIENTATION=-
MSCFQNHIAFMVVLVTVATLSIGLATAFSPNVLKSRSYSTSLSMAVKFDKASGKWYTDDPEKEGMGSSYGPIGSLYRAGPKPFLQRIFNADTYDQAVLKYMAQDGCDRKEAQGNMDAFLDNPQDWAYQKLQEQNGSFKKDYANANMAPKQVILSTVWGFGVIYFFGNLIYNGIQGGVLTDSFERTMELLSGDDSSGKLF